MTTAGGPVSCADVLVIAAHPDDEVLGCGGTIARLTSNGKRVHIAILGEGATSRFDQRDDADAAAVAALRSHSRQAGDILAAAQVHHFALPDNRFDQVPLLDVTKIIERLIEKLRPAVVFTQHGGDLNIDHLQTFRATLTATRPQAACPVRHLYAYEAMSSSDWSFGQFAPAFAPNFFVDISTTLETKLAAMRCYESETRPFPHPRSAEGLKACAARWGTIAGVPAAEAFVLIRSVQTETALFL